MKNFARLTLLFLAIGVLAGCSNEFYEADELETMQRRHGTIAVLPPDLDIASQKKPSPSTAMGSGKIKYAYEIQEVLGEKLRGESTNYTVSIISAKKAREMLNASGISYYDLYTIKTIVEPGNALHADGLVKGVIKAPKPLDGEHQAENEEIEVKITLYEANTETLLWSYEDKYEFNTYNDSKKLAEKIFEEIEGNFPYEE
ncbi:MAG: hypothetical protein K9I68_04580 [Bacteroidales bacterium]|nr:hypothetical protein [Bacteroidales bacterium]MCF8337580.1 hypothetical protein [Bacteroidales bacterium]